MFKALLFQRHLTYTQAAVYALAAYFFFTLSDSMGKWLMSEGYERSQVLVINSLPSTIALFVLMIKRHGLRRSLHTHYKLYHLMRCAALVSVTLFSFMALKALPLANFYGIAFSSPLLVTVGAFFLFKEKTDITEWLAIIVGFIGVLIVVNPDFNHFDYGYLWAILAVLSIVSAGLIVRRIGRDENPYLFVLFGNFGIIAANIIPALLHALPQVTPIHIAVFAFYAFTIPTAIFLLSSVFARAPTVTAVAPYQYSQIIWGSTLGYFLFGDIPQENTIIGSSIVIACGLYILFHHRRKSRRQLKEITTPTSNA